MTLTIREYFAADGKNPFRDWLDKLDVVVRARVQARVLRFETLLVGGDKASQPGDIRRARRSWREYLEATHHHGKTE